MTTSALDLKQQYKDLLKSPTDRVIIVNVPEMRFLAIDGIGDPNSAPAYKEAIEALYGVAYTLKFTITKEQGLDYSVLPLEGLWWRPDMEAFSVEHKEAWWWTMLMGQPEEVTPEQLERARDQVRLKRPSASLEKLRLEAFHEGLAAQIMHIGPYAAEGPTIARLHAFIHEQGYTFDGTRQKHHEIYLSDPRRTAPERMKTLLRQPFTTPA